MRTCWINGAFVPEAEATVSIFDRGVLFGDGAGAVVLKGSDQPGGVLSSILRSDGSGGDLLIIPAGGSACPLTSDLLSGGENTIRMNGREVYKFATRIMDRTVRDLMHKVGWTSEQIDLFVPHQANIRIIESAAKSLGLPMEKVFTNLEHYGNTSAASIPIAIAEAELRALVVDAAAADDDKIRQPDFGENRCQAVYRDFLDVLHCEGSATREGR